MLHDRQGSSTVIMSRSLAGVVSEMCPTIEKSQSGDIGHTPIEPSTWIAKVSSPEPHRRSESYNRIAFGKTDPIEIANNVWIGDSAIVCKGVSIGENSIIGAGAVVANSIPSNCIAAGNPAQVVKQLDPEESFTTRKQWYSKGPNLFYEIDQLDRELLRENTLLHWLRYVFFPSKKD